MQLIETIIIVLNFLNSTIFIELHQKISFSIFFFLYLPKIHYLGGFLTLYSSHEHGNRARYFMVIFLAYAQDLQFLEEKRFFFFFVSFHFYKHH